MNFRPMYSIEYGFLLKQRFSGALGKITPKSAQKKYINRKTTNLGNESIIKDIVFNKNSNFEEYFQYQNAKNKASYNFKIENGILYESIFICKNLTPILYTIKSVLNLETQQLFLDNIFKIFGVTLSIYIKEHNIDVTGQSYVLNEFKGYLEKHTQYTTTCGNYAYIQKKDNLGPNKYLGIEATYKQSTINELDTRKGITLYLYKDDENKKPPYLENFVICEKTYPYFSQINTEHYFITVAVTEALDKEGIAYDLLYSLSKKV